MDELQRFLDYANLGDKEEALRKAGFAEPDDLADQENAATLAGLLTPVEVRRLRKKLNEWPAAH